MIGKFYFHRRNHDILRCSGTDRHGDYSMECQWGEKWSNYGSFSPDRLQKELIFLGNTEEEKEAYLKHGAYLLAGGFSTEVSLIASLPPGEEVPSDSTALIERPSTVLGALAAAETSQRMVEAMKDQMMVAVEMKNKELQRIMDEAKAMVATMMNRVLEIQKVVRTIELYAGINEDLVQINEGFNAHESFPLCLRQMVIFMDEEVGQWRDGGFDYSNVENFDEWLKDPKNLNKVCPEQKCVVAFRPRRYTKDYGDRVENSIRNVWNRQTYFLVRNGSNVYRIFTENLQLGEKMFLGTQELQDKLSASDLDLYRRQAVFIQGLIERTDVFKPVPEGVNIFKPETYQGWLNLIFDLDGVLTDGRPSFKEWKAEINSHISEGSRVAFSPTWLDNEGGKSDRDCIMNKRTARFYRSQWNCPNPPWKPGVVTVLRSEHKGLYNSYDLAFKYQPGGETYSWTGGSSERKNKITFHFDRDEDLLNYDAISLEEVEYYLNDRVNRKNYAKMLPLLETIREARLKEIEWEESFVKLLEGRTRKTEMDIWDAVEWWKLKNKWKRPISQDDEKAIRMIEKRLNSNLYFQC